MHSAPSALWVDTELRAHAEQAKPGSPLRRPSSGTISDLTRRRPSLPLGKTAAAVALDRTRAMPSLAEDEAFDPRDTMRMQRKSSEVVFTDWLKVLS